MTTLTYTQFLAQTCGQLVAKHAPEIELEIMSFDDLIEKLHKEIGLDIQPGQLEQLNGEDVLFRVCRALYLHASKKGEA